MLRWYTCHHLGSSFLFDGHARCPFRPGQAQVPIGVKPALKLVMPIHEKGNDLDTVDNWPATTAVAEQHISHAFKCASISTSCSKK